MQLPFQAKMPDTIMNLRLTELDFDFRRKFPSMPLNASQWSLQDGAEEDASLFARCDEVELAWGIINPIISAGKSLAAPKLETYQPGLWGPEASTSWMREQGRAWFDICPSWH